MGRWERVGDCGDSPLIDCSDCSPALIDSLLTLPPPLHARSSSSSTHFLHLPPLLHHLLSARRAHPSTLPCGVLYPVLCPSCTLHLSCCCCFWRASLSCPPLLLLLIVLGWWSVLRTLAACSCSPSKLHNSRRDHRIVSLRIPR